MGQQLNKLGQVLVYDSDVELLDKTPGGNGFQSITLDNAGAFIGGTLSSSEATIVKASGTDLENGEALLKAYADAKEASESYTYDAIDKPAVATGYQWTSGSLGDIAQPFEIVGSDFSGNSFFTITVNTPDNFFISSQGLYTIEFTSNTGDVANVVINRLDGSSVAKTVSFSIRAILSGTAFALENLSTVTVAKVTKAKKTLLLSPGKYKMLESLNLDGYIDIKCAANYSSEISFYNWYDSIKYYGHFESDKPPTIEGIYGNYVFEIMNDASAGIFKNCKATNNSFIYGEITATGHKFYNCEVSGRGFGHFRSKIFNCEFYNCIAVFRSFGYEIYGMEDCIFKDCISSGTRNFLAYSAKQDSYIYNNIQFINCIGGGESFLSSCGANNGNGDFEGILFKGCTTTGGVSFGAYSYLKTNADVVFDSCTDLYESSSTTEGSFWLRKSPGWTVTYLNCFSQGAGFGNSNGQQATYLNCASLGIGSFFGVNAVRQRYINCFTTQNDFTGLDTFNPGGYIINCVGSSNTPKTFV